MRVISSSPQPQAQVSAGLGRLSQLWELSLLYTDPGPATRSLRAQPLLRLPSPGCMSQAQMWPWGSSKGPGCLSWSLTGAGPSLWFQRLGRLHLGFGKHKSPLAPTVTLWPPGMAFCSLKFPVGLNVPYLTLKYHYYLWTNFLYFCPGLTLPDTGSLILGPT